VQNIDLPGAILAGDLKPRTIDKVEADAVWQLLDLHLRGVWHAEVTEVITFDGTSLPLPRSISGGGCRRRSRDTLHRAQYEETLRVKAHGAPLPQEVVRELHIDIAHV